MEGGVGAFTRELARAINAAGNEVHIITSRHARPPERPRTLTGVNDPDELDFAMLHARIGRWRWPSLATIVDITLRQELDLVNIQYQPAAYNMNSPAINFLPWRLKHLTSVVVTYHDLRVPYLFPKAGSLRARAVQFMAKQASGVIATNSEDNGRLQAITGQPTAVIPIGSNIQPYEPNHLEVAEVRTDLGLDANDVLLGYFGFLNESKGADTLLQALAEMDGRYHLVFIGGQTGASDATNRAFLNQIKTLVSELGLDGRVHWTGFLSDTRVAAHLAASDIMVLPYKDGVSLRRGTLMAALAQGRPVITTAPRQPDPALADEKAIVLVPAEDAAALADTIRRVSADPALQQALGNNARALAQSFTWEHIAARTIDFYQLVSTTEKTL